MKKKILIIIVSVLLLIVLAVCVICTVKSPKIDIRGIHCAGYIKDENTPYIELYSEEGGKHIADVPWELVENFVANDRTDENYSFGYMNMDFYCGMKGDHIWAVACAKPTFSACSTNICTSSDKGKSWYVGDDIMRKGIVENVWFVTETEGYISYSGGGYGRGISKTTDGGKTWTHIMDDE